MGRGNFLIGRLRNSNIPFDEYSMLLRLQLSVAICCGFILLYSGQYFVAGSFLRVAAVGVLIAGAALLMGFLLGFIFCIPRTAKVPETDINPTQTALKAVSNELETSAQFSVRARSLVETNTNLVDISDWLTKILVGVGLVELNKIPDSLRRLSRFLGAGLRAGTPTPTDISTSEAFALGIVLFFFGAGFLIGYLWTRLYFQSALSQVADYARRLDKAWFDASEAETFMKAGQLPKALQVVDEALQVNPANSLALFTKARILKKLAQGSEKTYDKPLLREAIEYASAASKLLPGKGAPRYNLACYQALAGVDRAEVLANLRLAFELKPILRTDAGKDDDLISVREMPEFKELTNPTSVPSN